MREKFEKLPQIAKMIESGEVWWSEKYNSYSGSDSELDCYVDGAWYAYQEQQKKIDQLLDIINTGLRIEHNMKNQIHSLKEKIDTAIEYLDSIEGLVWYEQIKDILK